MPATTKSKHSPIGIDIREDGVYAAQFHSAKGNGAQFSWARFETRAEDGHSGTVAALYEMARDSAFVGRDANVSLASTEVDIRKLLLPQGVIPDESPEFMNVLRREARSVLTYEPEDAVIDYVPLGTETVEGADRVALLLIAARKESINYRLALLKLAGIRCRHLEPSPCSIVRSLSSTESICAVLDIGRNSSTVSIVQRSKLLFSRTFRFGTGRILEEFSAAMGLNADESEEFLQKYGINYGNNSRPNISEALCTGRVDVSTVASCGFDALRPTLDAFAKEVGRSVDYFMRHVRGGSVEEIVIICALAVQGLDSYLSERLSLPIRKQNLWPQEIEGSVADVPDICSYAGAIGLAMRRSAS